MINYRYKALSQGFSLLEAIVAMTMIATFGLAIFSWINGLLISVEKIEKNYKADEISRNVAEFLSDINIMENQQGNTELGYYQLSWKAKLIEPIQQGKSITGAINEFSIGLFQTKVTIEQSDRLPIVLDLRLVGYKGEIRPPF